MKILLSDAPTQQFDTQTKLSDITAAFNMPPLWVLWLFGYAYAFVIALVLQKLVMPIMPGLHAGHGLMNQDAILFHEMALEMANRIHALGWSEWHLMPGSGITANVGILAGIYFVFGADPVWFIPLNAGFHALGALMVLRLGLLLLPGVQGWVAGSGTALLFLIFPSALVWYGQNHKDAFLIAGYFMVLFAFVKSIASLKPREIFIHLMMMALGCGLIAIMRPHMLLVYTLAFSLAFCVIGIWKLVNLDGSWWPSFRNGSMALGVLLTAAFMAPIDSEIITNSTTTPSAHWVKVNSSGWHWTKTEMMPEFIDRKLEQASLVRAHFILSNRAVGANSLLNGDVMPANASEMAKYMPRALWVALFAPFPDSWLERPSVPRLIGSVETLIFYLMVPGILILIWRKPSLPVWMCLVISAVVLTVLGYTSPNAGTLHRVRYGPLFVFMLMGASGWVWVLGKLGYRMAASIHEMQIWKGESLLSEGRLKVAVSDEISGKRALGAGVFVLLISMVGALGFLIRDLLLIHRVDFSASLDDFYLSMMVPMLFVNILSLPLGDALTAALHRMKDQRSIQSLLTTASAFSLAILGLLCLFILVLGDMIYNTFAVGRDVNQISILIPLALMLLFFSGVVVTGNSLMNLLGKPAQAAAAQLIVPFATVVAILVAPPGHMITTAMLGMVAGQLLNLVTLLVLAKKHGYRLLTFPIMRMRAEKGIIVNYAWLAGAAFISSLSVPFNYWLASLLGPGAVSTWAIGSKLVQTAVGLTVAMMSAVWVPYFSRLLNAGLQLRIRSEVCLSLLFGSWGGGLAALVVLTFAGPMVMATMPSLQNEARIAQLTGVIQIGALQLPLLSSGLMLLKLSVVSQVSSKVVAATLIGLVANVVVGYVWLPMWGILGIAAAWCISTLVFAVFIMFATRAQSALSLGEILAIISSWLVIGAFAVAIHFKSLPIISGVISVGFLVFVAQYKIFTNGRIAPEITTG